MSLLAVNKNSQVLCNFAGAEGGMPGGAGGMPDMGGAAGGSSGEGPKIEEVD